MSSCSWWWFRVLLCWQMWASFSYRAVAMWQSNRSIPGGYPPPGVSWHPSYTIHHSYIVVLHTSSSFSPLFVVVHPLLSFIHCCMLFVHCCTPFVFVCHLYIIIVCMLLFVHHHCLVLHSLSYIVIHHLSLFVHCCSSFIHCLCGNVPRNIVENSLLVKDKKGKRYKKTCLGPK
jgi:hypothetical protein